MNKIGEWGVGIDDEKVCVEGVTREGWRQKNGNEGE